MRLQKRRGWPEWWGGRLLVKLRIKSGRIHGSGNRFGSRGLRTYVGTDLHTAKRSTCVKTESNVFDWNRLAIWFHYRVAVIWQLFVEPKTLVRAGVIASVETPRDCW